MLYFNGGSLMYFMSMLPMHKGRFSGYLHHVLMEGATLLAGVMTGPYSSESSDCMRQRGSWHSVIGGRLLLISGRGSAHEHAAKIAANTEEQRTAYEEYWLIWRINVFRYASGIQSFGSILISASIFCWKSASKFCTLIIQFKS